MAFQTWKIGRNLHANMEGFRRDSHMLITLATRASYVLLLASHDFYVATL